MPGARTHDILTVGTGLALAPVVYLWIQTNTGAEVALTRTALFVGAHLLSGIMFSPDLDLDSSIDDRWGIFFWIWRPYMWLIPHRRLLSHGLVLAPLLRLIYFYAIVTLLLFVVTFVLATLGFTVPDYHLWLTGRILSVARDYPRETLVFLIGFITGGAVHSIADWLVTGGKRYLRMAGIRVRSDYSRHDRTRSRR